MSDRNRHESPRDAARGATDEELAGRQPDVRRDGETEMVGTPGAGGIGQRADGGVTLPGDAAGGAEPQLGFIADDQEASTGPMNAADYVESQRDGTLPVGAERNNQRREK